MSESSFAFYVVGFYYDVVPLRDSTQHVKRRSKHIMVETQHVTIKRGHMTKPHYIMNKPRRITAKPHRIIKLPRYTVTKLLNVKRKRQDQKKEGYIRMNYGFPCRNVDLSYLDSAHQFTLLVFHDNSILFMFCNISKVSYNRIGTFR